MKPCFLLDRFVPMLKHAVTEGGGKMKCTLNECFLGSGLKPGFDLGSIYPRLKPGVTEEGIPEQERVYSE